MVVVKMEGPAYLCKTDEVGEICVGSSAGGSYYWGLKGTNPILRFFLDLLTFTRMNE